MAPPSGKKDSLLRVVDILLYSQIDLKLTYTSGYTVSMKCALALKVNRLLLVKRTGKCLVLWHFQASNDLQSNHSNDKNLLSSAKYS